jgi:UDP-glucose 4-epimerase
MKKEVLITGGAGFIGSHLVEELIKNKDYNITVVDDLSTGKLENIDKYSSKIYIIVRKIQDIKINNKFDIIYHLGAKANTREEGMNDYIDNVMATEVVTKMLKPEGHIYFSSSCAVYGNQRYVTETSPFQPISPYGYSKWMSELIIKTNYKNYTIFRFSNVFGERQDGSNEMGLIGVIEHCLKNNKVLFVFNRGENYRDYIYVKDVVRAMTTINKKDIFQVGRCKTYKTLELVKLSGVEWIYGNFNNEVDSIKLDNAKIKKLGWRPTLSVIDYIKRLKK